MYKDNKGNIDFAKMSELKLYTGYLPRELKTLAREVEQHGIEKGIASFVVIRRDYFEYCTNLLYYKSELEQKLFLDFF